MKNKPYKIFYSDEAKVYNKTRFHTLYGQIFKDLQQEIIEEILEKIPLSSRILEVACGTGHTSTLLHKKGYRFIACDLTQAMMQQAQRIFFNKPNAPIFIEANAKQLPFANNTFDLVISTRFLHLFSYSEQEEILAQMIRVLKPGGKILIDFDNWLSRWLLVLPYFIYNVLRYHRVAAHNFYNRIGPTKQILKDLSVIVTETKGVGGTHLVIPAFFSKALAKALGNLHKHPPLRVLSEQFILFGYKK